MLVHALAVGAGGFLGAVGRYGVTLVFSRFGSWTFPAATLAVNVLGCLAIGALMPLSGDRPLLGENARLFFVVGLLGGFTTFSAFGHETLLLFRRGASGTALAYVAASLVLGVSAVWLGRLAGTALAK